MSTKDPRIGAVEYDNALLDEVEEGDDVEYDYIDKRQSLCLLQPKMKRDNSMAYNTLYWSPSSEHSDLRNELHKLKLRNFLEEELE